MLTIDIHTHIIPDKLPDYSKKFGYEGFVRLDKINDSEANMMLFEKKFRTVQCNCWSPEVRIEDSKKSGVDVQVLSPIPIMFSYWADSNDALELSKFLNDSIADICNEYPKKFVGLGTVPMQSVKHAIKELERVMKAKFAANTSLRASQIGGVKAAAKIMNFTIILR